VSVNVSFTEAPLSSGYCFTTFNQLAQDIIANLTGIITGNFSGVSKGATAPVDLTQVWVKTDPSGNPIGVFVYLGAWLWPNPKAPGSGERMIWDGVLSGPAGLYSYDGGDNNGAVQTLTTGAMWIEDPNWVFRIPMGQGTNPFGGYNGNPATVLGQGALLGEEKHVMAALEDALHSHVMGNWDQTGGVNTHMAFVAPGTSPAIASTPSMNIGTTIQGGPPTLTQGNLVTSLAVAEQNATNAHNTLPPVRGIYMAKRTVRQFYTG
jgi:hypothetical protein